MKTIVVRPSERPEVIAQGKLSYVQIKAAGVAPGFAVGVKRANTCKILVVVKSDENVGFWAEILDVEKEEPTGGKPRASIHFGPPHDLDEAALNRVLSGIKWTSNNVRYIDWTPPR